MIEFECCQNVFQSLLGIWVNWNMYRLIFLAKDGPFQSLLGIWVNWNIEVEFRRLIQMAVSIPARDLG